MGRHESTFCSRVEAGIYTNLTFPNTQGIMFLYPSDKWIISQENTYRHRKVVGMHLISLDLQTTTRPLTTIRTPALNVGMLEFLGMAFIQRILFLSRSNERLVSWTTRLDAALKGCWVTDTTC